jgi:2-hydroxychromene-2-carboxylate isomerase
MTHDPPLELWFEFASTYSYIGVEAAAQLAVPVCYRPFLLGPIFAAQGWNDSPFNLFPAKGRYMLRDMERLCKDAGLPWRLASRFPRSGLLAARVAIAHAEAAWLPAFYRQVYRANFGFDREISEPSVLGELLTDLLLDAQAILERAHSPEAKQALRYQTARASALGIFGAPTWIAHGELFWGSDRMQQAVAWWRERALPS